MTGERNIESQVLDLFADEDEEVDVGTALETLLGVVGGLCLLGEHQTPLQLAETFSTGLRAGVIAAEEAKGLKS